MADDKRTMELIARAQEGSRAAFDELAAQVAAPLLTSIQLGIGQRLRVKLDAPSVIEPTLIAAVPLRSVALAVIVTAPKSICVSVVCTIPAMFVPEAAVVSSPPVNVLVSPVPLPSVIAPVFRNVVSVSIVVVVPWNTIA